MGDAHRGKNQEAAVIGNQVQALKLQMGRPADPGVPGAAFESSGLPAEQSDPFVPPLGDIAQMAAAQAPQAQVVVRAHQMVPAGPLLGGDQPQDDLAHNLALLFLGKATIEHGATRGQGEGKVQGKMQKRKN